MAELAADPDPRVSAAGLVGAQDFLGRFDANALRIEPEAPPAPSERDREELVAVCGAQMGAGGRGFRSLGQRLVRRRPTV